MSLRMVLLAAASIASAQQQLTGIPSSISSLAQATGGPQAPAPTSYSYTYTVTTPTTQWSPPAFSTPAPAPACAGTIAAMCPDLNGQTCVDVQTQSYGILCNTRFSGIVITTSGKKYLMEREEDLERIKLEEMYLGTGMGWWRRGISRGISPIVPGFVMGILLM
ncbi:hypothetical protein KC357_g6228 [Hortaea werneckii]|nr:hypothetical protein KC357_g6228 [Hortaea werneckii]